MLLSPPWGAPWVPGSKDVLHVGHSWVLGLFVPGGVQGWSPLAAPRRQQPQGATLPGPAAGSAPDGSSWLLPKVVARHRGPGCSRLRGNGPKASAAAGAGAAGGAGRGWGGGQGAVALVSSRSVGARVPRSPLCPTAVGLSPPHGDARGEGWCMGMALASPGAQGRVMGRGGVCQSQGFASSPGEAPAASVASRMSWAHSRGLPGSDAASRAGSARLVPGWAAATGCTKISLWRLASPWWVLSPCPGGQVPDEAGAGRAGCRQGRAGQLGRGPCRERCPITAAPATVVGGLLPSGKVKCPRCRSGSGGAIPCRGLVSPGSLWGSRECGCSPRGEEGPLCCWLGWGWGFPVGVRQSPPGTTGFAGGQAPGVGSCMEHTSHRARRLLLWRGRAWETRRCEDRGLQSDRNHQAQSPRWHLASGFEPVAPGTLLLALALHRCPGFGWDRANF